MMGYINELRCYAESNGLTKDVWGSKMAGRLIEVKSYDYNNGRIVVLSQKAQIRLHPENGVGLYMQYENEEGMPMWEECTGNVAKFIGEVLK